MPRSFSLLCYGKRFQNIESKLKDNYIMWKVTVKAVFSCCDMHQKHKQQEEFNAA